MEPQKQRQIFILPDFVPAKPRRPLFDSNGLARVAGGKPAPAVPYPALALER
jgi:hypothetical protein